jgi:hypothetical protein
MIPESLKSRIWFWWPYLGGLILFLGILAGVWFFVFPKSGDDGEPNLQDLQRARLTELSEPAQFIQAYIEANGGEEKLEQLQSVRSTGIFESGGQSVNYRTIKRRPDKSITTLEMPNFDLSFIVNGNKVWQHVEQPNAEPIDELKTGREAEAIRDLGYFFDPLMHIILHSPQDIVSIMPNIWKGQPCLTLEYDSAIRGSRARVFIDPDEMTPIVRIENFANGSKREVFYYDYHPLDGGLQEPHKVETFLDGELQNRIIVESIRANVGVIASIFDYTGQINATAAPNPESEAPSEISPEIPAEIPNLPQ